MALKKVKGTLERVLDKNLQDLVRGIRNHKETESKYIAECIDEIKQELRQDNLAVKANAISKLTYLQMLGYDISWAAFNVIEVMSSTKFTHKRIGYLAAAQSFHDGTDVLMLTTNLIRKDLGSQNMYDAGVALNGLSCFLTADLSRDLANDIMTLMTSTKPYLRKKAVLIMYKVFLRFPEALRPAFPRLKEKLEDPDPGVQSAAVNVICELARKNPKNYLSLAPLFFKLMTSSTNNWVLIKIIKLFSALTPLEPRLGKKLIEPLTNLIHSTSAMSLLYECINTVIAGNFPSVTMTLCVQKLRILIEDSDQNLKYLGLSAMSKILKTHPKSVQTHKDLILQCLDDKDESIRLRALDLLYGMVSKKNLMEIVKKLMIHMDKAEGSHYRDELLSKIIEICSQSNYQYITNFEWYVSILVELTRIEGTRHGKLIASQMLDVAIRVQAIRPFATHQMAVLLESTQISSTNPQRNGICEVLYAAAWICGEFSEHLKEPKATLEAMLRKHVTCLPGHIQSVFVQNILKLYSSILVKAELEDNQDLIKETGSLLIDRLPMFVQSADLEVQERACCILQLMKYIQKLQDKGVKVSEEVSALFAGELNPVAPKAQKKVPVPEGLDLDKWINEPPSDSSDEEVVNTGIFVSVPDENRYQNETRKTYEPTEEELERRREQRKMEQMNNPHYLKGGEAGSLTQGYNSYNDGYNDIKNDIPGVTPIDLAVPLKVPGMVSSDKYLQRHREILAQHERKRTKDKKKKKHRKKKGQPHSDTDEDDLPAMHAVSSTFDVPEGVSPSDNEDDNSKSADDPHKLLDINLDEPLRDDEKLPVRTHRIVDETSPQLQLESRDKVKDRHKNDKARKEKDKKKDKKDKKKEKKEKKKKKESDAPSLLLDGEDLENGVTEDAGQIDDDDDDKKKQVKKEAKENGTRSDDMDFWLSGSDAPSASKESSPLPPETPPGPPTPEKHVRMNLHVSDINDHGSEKSKKKKKKDKKEKKDKKKKSKQSEYEEAEGITTPSQEIVPPSQAVTPAAYKLPPMSNYKTLAENEVLKLLYETRVNHQQRNHVIISVIFNNTSSSHIKGLEFNILDSLNTKLVRGPGISSHEPIKVQFDLPAETQNESQFAFTVESIQMAQKLKGTLTYVIKVDEGYTHEKIDFKMVLPCTSYLCGLPCNGDAFAKLLSSGDLLEKYSSQFAIEEADFPPLLAKICFFAHFTVVEQIDSSASLYSRSIQGHDLCLLVKLLPNNVLSIDGKSSDGSLLSNVIDEIKVLLTKDS